MIAGRAAICGIGEIAPRRDTGNQTTVELISRVADLTVRDAGLSLRDVDGLVVHQIRSMSMGAVALVEMLGLQASFVDRVDHGGATGAAMVARAAMAVATGACTTCLCLTASTRLPGAPGPRVADQSPTAEFEEPYGGIGANYGYALIARRYMHEYGATPEQLANVAVQQRANACVNPDAIFYGQPLTLDDVLSSPMILDPLHLLEIVMPTGGAAGVLVTTNERARDLRPPAVRVLGVGEHVSHWSATYAPDLSTSAVKPAAERAFTMARVNPADIGLVSAYDCYTITVLLTLEDAGFCSKGEAGHFVEQHDLRWNGDFPLNTHGGQLSYGQSGIAGGMSHVTEAVRQLQGRAADRTVPGLELAFVHGNGGIMGEQVSLILGATR
jgi:acetyl-CoA acetyltransferase